MEEDLAPFIDAHEIVLERRVLDGHNHLDQFDGLSIVRGHRLSKHGGMLTFNLAVHRRVAAGQVHLQLVVHRNAPRNPNHPRWIKLLTKTLMHAPERV